jgi:hypothetical protein
MKPDLLFPCIHDGRRVELAFEQAYQLIWACSIGYFAPLHWLRYSFSGYTNALYLAGKVGAKAMDFGMDLMKNGRRVLTYGDYLRLHPSSEEIGENAFVGRASRFAREAFPGVPLADRPFRFVKIYSRESKGEPGYQMREDNSWLLVFKPMDCPADFDWSLFQQPPKE